MDPRIRSLIVSHGGYTYEVAGCVVAFFSDPRQSKMLGGFLTQLAQVVVEQCGSQLSFPASARLAYSLTAATFLDAKELAGKRREAGQRPMFRRPPSTRLPSTDTSLLRPEHAPWNRMPNSAAAESRNPGLFKPV